MHKEINSITRHFFQKDSLDQVSEQDIREFIAQYPYAAPGRLLLAKKKHDKTTDPVDEELITAGLYLHNPLRLEWLLSRNDEENGEQTTINKVGDQEEHQSAQVEKEAHVTDKPVVEDSPIAFQSYHTIDYFASQGIRLQQADLGKDKLGQQLKSFTEWLRSMKKLPSAEMETSHAPEDVTRQQHVIRSAAHSIEEKEVLTEAMAEVWTKQGNREKAMEIYNKLSLQNPAKSAYFAAKIDQLK